MTESAQWGQFSEKFAKNLLNLISTVLATAVPSSLNIPNTSWPGQNKAKAISAKLLELTFKNELEETGETR